MLHRSPLPKSPWRQAYQLAGDSLRCEKNPKGTGFRARRARARFERRLEWFCSNSIKGVVHASLPEFITADPSIMVLVPVPKSKNAEAIQTVKETLAEQHVVNHVNAYREAREWMATTTFGILFMSAANWLGLSDFIITLAANYVSLRLLLSKGTNPLKEAKVYFHQLHGRLSELATFTALSEPQPAENRI